MRTTITIILAAMALASCSPATGPVAGSGAFAPTSNTVTVGDGGAQ